MLRELARHASLEVRLTPRGQARGGGGLGLPPGWGAGGAGQEGIKGITFLPLSGFSGIISLEWYKARYRTGAVASQVHASGDEACTRGGGLFSARLQRPGAVCGPSINRPGSTPGRSTPLTVHTPSYNKHSKSAVQRPTAAQPLTT